ncbi:MAG: dTMP kinase [Succinivibrionaceae bacterium]
MKGKFIVIEGCEGAGKTTAVNTVKKYLLSQGINETDIICTREPGGTPIAEEIRNILKKVNSEDTLCSEAESLLMYASRIQLVKTKIIPALESGKYVIGDRHDLSSVAYQGAGRGLSRDFIDGIRKVVLNDFKPHLTIVMDLPPEIGLTRARNRGALDRFELEDIEFFNRIRHCFLEEASKDKEHIKVVDASLDLITVTDNILSILRNNLCING